MMSKNDFIVNGEMAAMPVSVTLGPSGDFMTSADYGYTGLTKREHFAAMAIQGIVSNSTCRTGEPEWKETIVRDAIDIADALLLALEQKA